MCALSNLVGMCDLWNSQCSYVIHWHLIGHSKCNMTREQGTAPTSASHLKIVGTAYAFNTYCFSTRAIFFKHVSALNTYGYLSPEQIWLVHLCLHFLPICCTSVQCTTPDFSQNLESTNGYCMPRNFDVKSSTVKRLKKVVHA